ncbi:DUF6268 family outer membrane beta-barrel protein [Dokdonia sp. Hel_I_53]|uniref:DUF6268 family outer membrane beta-barrel protein n=1 Tax=Dokdonia sp. Hel_I_53 TaxID=1566287 RepID=UPI00119A137B|nr:DUF6268 family outer membrane beta-barrel protein [Dokdonia sp. Hel_I_53]TVZ52886.1 hypothetical protein OD90_2072 [Dokdonia sp. Hel_I_53]
MNRYTKSLPLAIFLFAFAKAITAQSYVDLVKFNYGSIINAGYENSDEHTDISLINGTITLPIPVTEDVAIITGAEFISQNLSLSPNAFETNISSIALRAGLSWKHSDKWSGTYVLIPKMAGEELNFEGDNFFLGAIALLKYQKTSSTQYRFGIYASDEAFGTLVTPILGMYYNSPSNNWEVTANLPLTADVNYSFNPGLALGFALQSQVRSYGLKPIEGIENRYVQGQNIEFGPYIQQSFLDKKLLLNFQTGYASIDYASYAVSDKVSWRLLAFDFGDNRTQLNPVTTGSIFLRIGAIYRFHLKTDED